jgi:hypothetical protein
VVKVTGFVQADLDVCMTDFDFGRRAGAELIAAGVSVAMSQNGHRPKLSSRGKWQKRPHLIEYQRGFGGGQVRVRNCRFGFRHG